MSAVVSISPQLLHSWWLCTRTRSYWDQTAFSPSPSTSLASGNTSKSVTQGILNIHTLISTIYCAPVVLLTLVGILWSIEIGKFVTETKELVAIS